MDETELMRTDYDAMSDTDVMVLFLLSDSPVSGLRLQKLSLILSSVYPEHLDDGPVFSHGFSDEVEESVSGMDAMGIASETARGFVVTGYGDRLKKFIANEHTDETIPADSERISD